MILLWEGPYEKTLEESYKRGERFPLFFWSRANVSTCIVVYMCSIMAALHCNDIHVESRPRKRGRYNNHRRDVSLQKPKSTVYRQNHKARQLDTAENDQSSEEINDALLESDFIERFKWLWSNNSYTAIPRSWHVLFCISLQPWRIVSTWRQ